MSQDDEWFEGRSVDAPYERCYWRRVGFAMFLGFVLALFVVAAHGAPTFRGQGDNGPIALVLLDDPCKDAKVLSHIKQEWHSKLRAARLTWGGREWASCWLEMGGLVYSIDEEGAPLQAIPRRAFRDNST